MGEDVSAVAVVSPKGTDRTTVFLSPANGHQDAFDKDDFDAVAYINEMFPTGEYCFRRAGKASLYHCGWT